MTSEGSFEFVDEVTSDLTVVARGATREAVFGAAAEALLAATVENPEAVAGLRSCRVRLSDHALDLLLLRFLNELIFLRDSERLLLRPERVTIGGGEEGEPFELEAELVGEELDASRHVPAGDVKATTAHGLRVAPREGDGQGWEARVTFDV